jgi:hypothetical protein
MNTEHATEDNTSNSNNIVNLSNDDLLNNNTKQENKIMRIE